MKALFYDKAKEDGDNIVKNDYTLTRSAVLANFLDDVKLCFSLQIPSQCYSLEFFQVVPSGQGSGVLWPHCSLKLLWGVQSFPASAFMCFRQYQSHSGLLHRGAVVTPCNTTQQHQKETEGEEGHSR